MSSTTTTTSETAVQANQGERASLQDVKIVWDTIVDELNIDPSELPKCSEKALEVLIRAKALSITFLDMKDGLKRMPDSMRHLVALERLFLNNCPLAEIPKFIGEFSELQIFRCSGVATTLIPDEVTKLTNIKDFRVNGEHKITDKTHIVEQSQAIQAWLKTNGIRLFRVVS